MIEALFNQETYTLSKALLDAKVLRHEALASNLANVETPGYRRLDIDPSFDHELANLMAMGDVGGIRELQPSLVDDNESTAMRMDGNNVELDRELLEVNRNALEHQFLAQFMTGSLLRLKTAITGRV